MRIVRITKGMLPLLLFPFFANAQDLSPEDVQDLDEQTGVGCIEKTPVSEQADYYVICKSSKSGEQAWNAALYRSKIACKQDKFSVYFNVPPSLPIENGIHGAQVEVACSTQP